MECDISKSTDAELTPCTDKNTITYERSIFGILCLPSGLWQQLEAFEISDKGLSEIYTYTYLYL